MSAQKEFGDFQTPVQLAERVIELTAERFGKPTRIIEPTAGTGTFLEAAYGLWGSSCSYEGYEINPAYIQEASKNLAGKGVLFKRQDFFDAPWEQILNRRPSDKLLIVGNPPWVTNSALGCLGSANLPEKANFQGLRGFDAKTGKSNFDIAEWMLIKLFQFMIPNSAIAMLCKTMTARKVLLHFWKTRGGVTEPELFSIDAKLHFGASVDACLFCASGAPSQQKTARVYSGLSRKGKSFVFGLEDGGLVSSVEQYWKYRDIDGGAPYTWRSGIKHDAANIMELAIVDGVYVNGLGEKVDIEPDYIYPLLKSSDLANKRDVPRYSVLITQSRTGDITSTIQETAPKTWRYLQSHGDLLDARKSSIYRNRPRFCIFGVGDYSFSSWKVAISGIYKSFCFAVVAPIEGRPVMLDDTCYFVACNSLEEAVLIGELLNSDPCQQFLGSLVFQGSKRPVTTEILRRLSFAAIARRLGKFDELDPFVRSIGCSEGRAEQQLSLVMESEQAYKSLLGKPGQSQSPANQFKRTDVICRKNSGGRH